MKGNLRLIMIGLVAIIVLAFVFLRGDQLVELVETVQKGTPIFLILAVGTQFGKYFSQGGAYIWCFRTVEENINFSGAIKLVFGTFFMNTVAPSMNLAGMTLVVDDARKRGIPTGRGTSAALLMQVTIDTGFVIIMFFGFTILGLTVGIQPGWLLLGLVAVVLVGSLVTVMILGGVRPDLVIKVLKPFERLANKILRKFKRKPLDNWAENIINQFSDAAGLIIKNPRRTATAFLFSIMASTFELACFSLVGVSFGVDMAEPLICGYVVATLFAMISFVPQGVGVVEAAVLVAFTLFGIDQATGMATILVYRGIVFWLPFLIGAIMIQRTNAFKQAGKKAPVIDGAQAASSQAAGASDTASGSAASENVASATATSTTTSVHVASANVASGTAASGAAASDSTAAPNPKTVPSRHADLSEEEEVREIENFSFAEQVHQFTDPEGLSSLSDKDAEQGDDDRRLSDVEQEIEALKQAAVDSGAQENEA